MRRGSEDVVDATGREPDPAPSDRTISQVARDCLPSYWSSFATGFQREDLAHDALLLVVDDKDFLVLGAASFGDAGFVTEGRVRAVPKPLARVRAHRPMNMLDVLARLMIVKDIQELRRSPGLRRPSSISR
jgi:hypothetical protein